MKQNAADIPVHNFQRKAAIATGSVRDHAGRVRVSQIKNFDLDRTIFNTLEGMLPRFVMRTRIAKEVVWYSEDQDSIDTAYMGASDAVELPEISSALLKFLVEECDFDVEHADGSFLDHLYFCYEYTYHHLPKHSPLVMLLHSILGTGTNTFAMTADKIPKLQTLVDEEEWLHIESFPSVLRLLYEGTLLTRLLQDHERLDQLQNISFFRVIDNQAITMSAEQLWVQLNYQIIHLVDFLPVSNWYTHANDTSFILFRTLYGFLETTGHLVAKIDYVSTMERKVLDEEQTWGAKLISKIPVSLSKKMAAKSIRQFSNRIDHSLDFTFSWS